MTKAPTVNRVDDSTEIPPRGGFSVDAEIRDLRRAATARTRPTVLRTSDQSVSSYVDRLWPISRAHGGLLAISFAVAVGLWQVTNIRTLRF